MYYIVIRNMYTCIYLVNLLSASKLKFPGMMSGWILLYLYQIYINNKNILCIYGLY